MNDTVIEVARLHLEYAAGTPWRDMSGYVQVQPDGPLALSHVSIQPASFTRAGDFAQFCRQFHYQAAVNRRTIAEHSCKYSLWPMTADAPPDASFGAYHFQVPNGQLVELAIAYGANGTAEDDFEYTDRTAEYFIADVVLWGMEVATAQ